MQRVCIEALAKQQIEQAGRQEGRKVAADTVVGGNERALRQTVVGITKGNELGQRVNSGEATAYVVSGRVRMTAGDSSWTVRSGDLLIIPDTAWNLEALEDSALLLTVSMGANATDDDSLQSPGLATAAAS